MDLCKNDEKKVALVHPSCVLTSTEEYRQFHPFLLGLPAELSPLSLALKEIGVQFNIKLHQMQTVLEKAFVSSEGLLLDPNTQNSVELAVKKLVKLHAGKPDDVVESLTPLYLPDSQGYLKISTCMLYKDIYSYFGCLEVDLTDTPYSHFDIGEEAYGFSALDLCHLLPLQVCPKGMSQKCKQLPDRQCQPVDSTEIALKLERFFQDQNNADILVKVINKFVPNLNLGDLKLHIEKLLFSICVTTVCNLSAQIVLSENNRIIGRMKSEYFFHYDDSESCLYVDSVVDEDHGIGLELAELILTKVYQYGKGNLSSETRVSNFIGRYLTSTASKKLKLLEKLDIVYTTTSCTVDLKVLGVEIPPLYLHMLDQDPYDIFKPMEYVGYEIMDNKIIVDQVAYIVPQEEVGFFY